MLRAAARRAEADNKANTAEFLIGHADLLAACRARTVGVVFGESAQDLQRPVVPKHLAPLLQEALELQRAPSADHDVANLRQRAILFQQVLEDPACLKKSGIWEFIELDETRGTRKGGLWAFSQRELADVKRRLAGLLGDPHLLREAVAGYDAALSILTRAETSATWVKTQAARAGALADLGEQFGETAALHEAVVGYDAALEIYTRAKMPREWAATSLLSAMHRLCTAICWATQPCCVKRLLGAIPS